MNNPQARKVGRPPIALPPDAAPVGQGAARPDEADQYGRRAEWAEEIIRQARAIHMANLAGHDQTGPDHTCAMCAVLGQRRP